MGLLDKVLLDITYNTIKQFGGSCVLKRTNKGQYDPLQGDTEPKAANTWNLPCTPEQSFSKRMFMQSKQPGSNIKSYDFMIVIPAKTLNGFVPAITPEILFTVQRNGKWFQVVAIDPINSGDVNVGYQLLCKA